jgi:hypothetical protein
MALALPENHNNSRHAKMLTTVTAATKIDQKLLVKSLIFYPLSALASVLTEGQHGGLVKALGVATGVGPHDDANERDETGHRGHRAKGVDIEFHG